MANGEEDKVLPGASSRLTRDDWIDAAWTALSEGSIDTVKVDRLAKRLKVTRGSFYWHFKKREELIDAVVDRWLQRLGRTLAVQHLLDAAKPASERLWDVYEYVIRTVSGPQSVFLRIAAIDDRILSDRMAAEDRERIEGYRILFAEMGLAERDAADFAEAFYSLVMSEFLRKGAFPMAERLAYARRQHAFIIAAARRFSGAGESAMPA